MGKDSNVVLPDPRGLHGARASPVENTPRFPEAHIPPTRQARGDLEPRAPLDAVREDAQDQLASRGAILKHDVSKARTSRRERVGSRQSASVVCVDRGSTARSGDRRNTYGEEEVGGGGDGDVTATRPWSASIRLR